MDLFTFNFVSVMNIEKPEILTPRNTDFLVGVLESLSLTVSHLLGPVNSGGLESLPSDTHGSCEIGLKVGGLFGGDSYLGSEKLEERNVVLLL